MWQKREKAGCYNIVVMCKINSTKTKNKKQKTKNKKQKQKTKNKKQKKKQTTWLSCSIYNFFIDF